jgi:hypothetical protein
MVGRSVLSCPLNKKEKIYNQPYRITDYSHYMRCMPYTKTILDMNYERYYGIQTSKCLQTVELPQKIFHASSIGVPGDFA